MSRYSEESRRRIRESDDRLVAYMGTDQIGARIWFHDGRLLVQADPGSGSWTSEAMWQSIVLHDSAWELHRAGLVEETTLLRNAGNLARNRELLIRLRDFQLFREVEPPEDLSV